MQLQQAMKAIEIASFGYVIFLLALTIHELGHLAAAMAVGFHIVSYRIGPLEFRPREGPSITVHGKNILSGAVKFRSKDLTISHVDSNYLFCTFAGPLSNLGTMLLVIWLDSFKGISAEIAGFFIIASALFIASALLFIGSLIPVKGGEIGTDGRQIYMYLFHRKPTRNIVFARLTILTRVEHFRALFHAGKIQEASIEWMNSLVCQI